MPHPSVVATPRTAYNTGIRVKHRPRCFLAGRL
jgi:hypothetical protein